MASTLQGVLAAIPGLGGYLAGAQNDQSMQSGQIQQMSALQGILAGQQKMQAQQQELARMGQYRQRLAAAKTPEEQAAIAAEFEGPSGLLKHADRQATISATQESARARLQQTAQQFQLSHEARMRGLTNQEDKVREVARHNSAMESLQQEAQKMTGARLLYDTGMTTGAPSAAPQQPQGVEVTVEGRKFTVPDAATALSLGRSVQGLSLPPEGATEMPGQGRPVVPEQPAATPAAPQPAASPVAAPAAPAAAQPSAPAPQGPVMPPNIAAAPKKVQDAWLLAQSKEGQQADRIMQGQVAKGLEEAYTKLRDVPQAMANIEKAKALIPKANLFQGSLGEQKLNVAKFFNNNLGTSINLDGVKSAEELRSRIFFNIMDNLKKMDAQPSEQQQRVMQEALGKLGTDPSALGNILDAFGEVMREKVKAYEQQVAEAKNAGINWPHRISIPAAASPRQAPSASYPTAVDANGNRVEYRDGAWQPVKK